VCPFAGVDLGAGDNLKLAQFADDSAITPETKAEGDEGLALISNIFCPATDMKLNLDKTVWALLNGTAAERQHLRDANCLLVEDQPNSKYLGRPQGVNLATLHAWLPHLESGRKVLAKCTERSIKPHARAMVTNSMYLSKFIHVAQTVVVPLEVLKSIRNTQWSYLWRHSAEADPGTTSGPVPRYVCQRKTGNGGLGMVDFSLFCNGLVLRWLDRLASAHAAAGWLQALNSISLCDHRVPFLQLLLADRYKPTQALPALWRELIHLARKYRPPVVEGKGLWGLHMPIFDCQALGPKIPSTTAWARTLLGAGIYSYAQLWRPEAQQWKRSLQLRVAHPTVPAAFNWLRFLGATRPARQRLRQAFTAPPPPPPPPAQLQPAYTAALPVPDPHPAATCGAVLHQRPGRAALVSDGASRNNPGAASCGFSLIDPNGVLVQEAGIRLPPATNNVAEYLGAISGTFQAVIAGLPNLDLFLDSHLIVRQLNGEARVKEARLKPLYACLVALLTQIPDWSASHIYREVNKRSDFMCNLALDEDASWCLHPVSMALPLDWAQLVTEATRVLPPRYIQWWAVGQRAKSNLPGKVHQELLGKVKRAPRAVLLDWDRMHNPDPLSFKVDWESVWATIQSPWLSAAQRHTCWAALQNGLYVGSRLGRIFQASPLCGLCETVSPVPYQPVETLSHLFNSCLYTKRVFAHVAARARWWVELYWEQLESPPSATWVAPASSGATFLWTHGFTAKAQGAGALLLQLAYLFTLHAVWRARTNQRYHDRYPPPTYVVGSTTLKLLSSTIRVAYRKDATKFRQAALPAALAQVVIGDDFSTVL
jgi:ribonuclease HI